MLTFDYPWLALLLSLPWLAWRFLPPHAETRVAVRVPFFERLSRLSGAAPEGGPAVTRRGLGNTAILSLCWLLVLAALMRPQWIEPPLHRDRPTRDLLLLVDLSQSMEAKDFTDANGGTVDRLTAVKQVLDDFLARREGDRVGLVVFGDAAFVQVPFTTDLALCRRLLQEAAVGMAGARTAFGDAIGLGITLFAGSAVRHKTMIALTDGNDTASQVPPAEAAGVAKDKGITIHTVAIGDPAAIGEEKLDEDALKAVAKRTGGDFFRAMDRAGLAGIYQRLDEIEVRQVETATFRPKTDLYWAPVGLLLVVTLLHRAAALVASRRRDAHLARGQAERAA
jgi:Ca-activated chloride channel family protein